MDCACTGQAAKKSPLLLPAQIAVERVQGDSAILDFSNASISGNATTDIGIYAWDSVIPTRDGIVFGTLAETYLAEAP